MDPVAAKTPAISPRKPVQEPPKLAGEGVGVSGFETWPASGTAADRRSCWKPATWLARIPDSNSPVGTSAGASMAPRAAYTLGRPSSASRSSWYRFRMVTSEMFATSLTSFWVTFSFVSSEAA